MFTTVQNFKPLRREHARWLRDVYNNMTRFSGRGAISVVHAEEGTRVVKGEGAVGHGLAAREADFLHRGGLLSTQQLNRIIKIYNAAAAMYGTGVEVVKSQDEYLFIDGDGGGGFHNFKSLPMSRAGDASRTIFNRRIMNPLVTLANAWVSARTTEPLTLTKARWNYILEEAAAAIAFSECFLEDWETQLFTGLGFLNLHNWDVQQNNVDVLGPAGFDPLPGNGTYIDMSGTLGLGDFAGTILKSKERFNYAAGSYTFRYVLAGDNRGNGNSTVSVNFHTVNTSHTLTTAQGATTFSHTLTGPIYDWMTFEQTAVDTPDQSKGTLLLEIEICDA
jgi:hypothetical protein